MKYNRLSLALIALSAAFVAASTSFAQTSQTLIRQGGVTILQTDHSDLVSASIGDNRIPVTQTGLVLVPVHMDTRPGTHQVSLTHSEGSQTLIEIEVQSRTYREERLQIANQRLVEPNPEDVARYTREAALQRKVYESFSDMRELPFPMKKPIEGRRSSEFGVRRFFNDQPRSPHSGLDLAAPTGTPISAPASGTVALTGDFFFSGNLVMIDHGAGIISMLGHMSEILVEEGQRVRQGDLIGKVGATGRATGAHVHWTLSIGGVRVDPELALELSAP